MGALYRRVRPLTFEEVVGQEHVKEPLERAIREGRLAQAYLFSGPRGVGKTTTARLLAMGVGCTGGVKPCGVCEHCRAVREGRHPDVLEIDAASHNSVEDVRELREKLFLSPIAAPKKVFIFDEAHMLSKSAFNALLKTLEEPPEHVLFIFATTEPERMPPTILSRTQHFRFRRLGEEEITAKLRRILEEMERRAEEEALALVARLADGSMRDAESLLDRLLLLEGPLTREKVEEAFGLVPKDALLEVAKALAGGRPLEGLELARALYRQGFAAKSLLLALFEVLREELALAFAPGKNLSRLGLSPLAIVRGMEALDEVLVEMNRRPDLLGLELALLRVYAAWDPHEPLGAMSEGQAPSSRSRHEDPGPVPEQSIPHPLGEEGTGSSSDISAKWGEFLQSLRTTLRAFLREGQPELREGRLVIRFSERNQFHYQRALEKKPEYLELARRILGVEDVEPVLGMEKRSPDPVPLERKATPNRLVQSEAPRSEDSPGEEAVSSEGSKALVDPSAPLHDPQLQWIRRLFGAELIYLKPRGDGFSTPLSEGEIGGNGI
ncbi:MAG: DNA polymerase III subunit gamma/tau [Thermaceae bacterium]